MKIEKTTIIRHCTTLLGLLSIIAALYFNERNFFALLTADETHFQNLTLRAIWEGVRALVFLAGIGLIIFAKRVSKCCMSIDVNLASPIIIVLLTLALIEAGIRITGISLVVPDTFQEMINSHWPQGYAEQTGTRYSRQDVEAWSREFTPSAQFGTKYYDYSIYATRPGMHIGPESDGVVFTNYFSARNTPDSVPLASASTIIWTFGGSTMQNLETSDRLSIANIIALSLNNSGFQAHVKNFGVGSFQSSQELTKFVDLLRRLPETEWPHWVIFYDGFNESYHSFKFGAGNLQLDLSQKLAALVEKDFSTLTPYVLSENLAYYSKAWQNIGKPVFDKLFFQEGRSNTHAQSAESLTKGVATYLFNTRMVKAVCAELGIRPLFVLQPVVYTKKNPTLFERQSMGRFDPATIEFGRQFYKQLQEEVQGMPEHIDLSGLFDNNKYPDFYDLGHTSKFSGINVRAGGRAESAGINRHRVGDERALHGRRSCSIMTPSHARVVVRLHVKR